jgi:uncharacterized protein YbaR (Trm112 family)
VDPRLTDVLTCPRCGPAFGLILLADEVRDLRVLEGRLGCPNCREHYPVDRGYADLRPPPRAERPAAEGLGSDDPEGAIRLGALLGVREGPGVLLLMGRPVRHAERLAAMVERIEVVAAHAGLRNFPETPGVSRLRVGERLPFRSGTLRGAAAGGREADRHLAEAVRVLAPGARLVVVEPEGDLEQRMEDSGLELLLVTARALVGVPAPPRMRP